MELETKLYVLGYNRPHQVVKINQKRFVTSPHKVGDIELLTVNKLTEVLVTNMKAVISKYW